MWGTACSRRCLCSCRDTTVPLKLCFWLVKPAGTRTALLRSVLSRATKTQGVADPCGVADTWRLCGNTLRLVSGPPVVSGVLRGCQPASVHEAVGDVRKPAVFVGCVWFEIRASRVSGFPRGVCASKSFSRDANLLGLKLSACRYSGQAAYYASCGYCSSVNSCFRLRGANTQITSVILSADGSGDFISV